MANELHCTCSQNGTLGKVTLVMVWLIVVFASFFAYVNHTVVAAVIAVTVAVTVPPGAGL
jgi:hypothetical protein